MTFEKELISLSQLVSKEQFKFIFFLLIWLLKEMQDFPEVKHYHIYLEITTEFHKSEKHIFCQFKCYLIWSRNFLNI